MNPGTTIAGMAKPTKEPNLTTYAGRVSARLRELRESRGLTVAKLCELLEAEGVKVKQSTLYAYELGKDAGGVNLPLELVPPLAKAFGFKSAHGWLPVE